MATHGEDHAPHAEWHGRRVYNLQHLGVAFDLTRPRWTRGDAEFALDLLTDRYEFDASVAMPFERFRGYVLDRISSAEPGGRAFGELPLLMLREMHRLAMT